MQQEHYRCICFAGRAIEHLHAIGFDPMDGRGRYAESAILLARRCAFHVCSRRCVNHELSPHPSFPFRLPSSTRSVLLLRKLASSSASLAAIRMTWYIRPVGGLEACETQD